MMIGSNKALNIYQEGEVSVAKDLCAQVMRAKCKDVGS